MQPDAAEVAIEVSCGLHFAFWLAAGHGMGSGSQTGLVEGHRGSVRSALVQVAWLGQAGALRRILAALNPECRVIEVGLAVHPACSGSWTCIASSSRQQEMAAASLREEAGALVLGFVHHGHRDSRVSRHREPSTS